jgi:Succinate dehydrogenase/fumarate reductase, flavoprotein subunit
MENESILLDGFEIRCFSVNTLVIGSGAAALNAAVSLHSFGQHDIVIATSQWGGGTSNNAGSDKQTYYKLSLSGTQPDSVPEMAADLFNGKCMHGDIALCEAQGSVRAFMNLVSLGVRFPHDRYGSWAGYKTDHDPRSRATSAGPYTSKRMFEALAGEVKKRKIMILDRHLVISLLTDRDKSRVTGALAINTREKDPAKAFVLFNCENMILGTGGPAGIYETSVYPLSQSGSIGMAFKAGASGQNLTESQFGIASVKFRWNLSGSYQQAIPVYISTDKKGGDRREFLNQFFPDYRSLTKAIFLKGYQWPFDPRKIDGYGSSLIDLLVYREITEKKRRVFLDYTANPSYQESRTFSFDELDPEVFNYFKNSNALKKSPLERLLAINFPAYDLYKEHGIDLSEEMLEIAVCAQHNNGGLKGDIWWESDLKHLFPVGEVNGSHGVYRQGGAALNSGQVGGYRAAQKIFKRYNGRVMGMNEFMDGSKDQIIKELSLAKKWIAGGRKPGNKKYLLEIRKRMSEAAGIIRNPDRVSDAVSEAEEMLEYLTDRIGAGSVRELAGSFQLMDHCLTHFIYLEAIREYLAGGGRSRGSYLVTGNNSAIDVSEGRIGGAELCGYDRTIEKEILEVKFREGRAFSKLVKPREIPAQNLWFEKVWKDYLEDNSEGY